VLAKVWTDDYSNLLHALLLTHSSVSVGNRDSVPRIMAERMMKQRKQDLDSASATFRRTFPLRSVRQ